MPHPSFNNNSLSSWTVSGDTVSVGIGGCPQDGRSGAGLASRRRDECLSDEDIQSIAVEHVRWAHANGQSFDRIAASVGIDAVILDFDGAVLAIARAQVRLCGRDDLPAGQRAA